MSSPETTPSALRVVKSAGLVIAEVVFGIVLAAVLCIPLLYGYFAVSCPDTSSTMLMILLMAVYPVWTFPPQSLALTLAVGLAISLLLRPFRDRRFWKRLRYIALAALLLGVLCYFITDLSGLEIGCYIL